MAKYKAIMKGFDGVKIREPGDVFDFDGPQGRWMKKLDGKEDQKAQGGVVSKPEGKKPTGEKSVI